MADVRERGQRRRLAKAINVVAVPYPVQRPDEYWVADEVAYALKAKRVSLAKRAGHDDVREPLGQTQRIFVGEVNIRLVQNRHATLRGAKLGQVARCVAAAAGRVRRRDVS